MDQHSAQIGYIARDVRTTTEHGAARFHRDTVIDKLHDAQTPGYHAEFDPEEAESAGAFVEDALSEEDALDSVHDATPFIPHLMPQKS